MTTFVATEKRGRTETNGNFDGPKRVKAMDSIQSGMEIKSKPCHKFLSGAGCPFGDNCRYLHALPVGFNPIAQMNMINQAIPSMLPMGHSAIPGAAVKTRICNRFNTPEGCKFGDRCNFAHGEDELGDPVLSSNADHGMTPPMMGRLMGRPDHFSGTPTLGGFGASATAKISVKASLAGGIIGKGGCNTKEITRRTGAKLCIRDQDSDANVKYIEMEGTFDQIKCASNMVQELIAILISSKTILPMQANNVAGVASGAAGSNFKTKLCEKFANGACTFGDRCNFAHGEDELRNNDDLIRSENC